MMLYLAGEAYYPERYLNMSLVTEVAIHHQENELRVFMADGAENPLTVRADSRQAARIIAWCEAHREV